MNKLISAAKSPTARNIITAVTATVVVNVAAVLIKRQLENGSPISDK